MREIDIQNSYKKDYKLVKKQGWDLQKVRDVILELQTCDTLSHALSDHSLQGDLKDFRECHICGDLVIIYKRDSATLWLYRIGRHQDLFKGY